MTTRATPLSAVSTTWEESSLRVLKASHSFLVVLGVGPLLGAKTKHPQVGALSQVAPQPVDEIAPPSQIPGLNLTQFNNIGNFRPNMAQHIPRASTGPAGLETCSIDLQLSCFATTNQYRPKLFST